MHDVTVKLASPLRKYAAGMRELSMQARDIGEVLHQIRDTYPELGTRIFNTHNELNHFVGVYVGQTNILDTEGLAHPLSAGEIVTLVVAVAGG